MNFLGALVVVVTMVAFSFHYWDRLLLGGDKRQIRRWFIDWVGKGLGMPVLLWIIFNSGAHPVLPPFVSSVILGKAGGRFGQILALTTPALLVIGTYWSAVSFAWLLANVVTRGGQLQDFLVLAAIWGVIMAFPSGLIGYLGGWLLAGVAGLVFLFPLVHFAEEAMPKRPRAPVYARAVAKLKFGKYGEAEQAIINELEKFEDDFNGWLMLAEIYAVHFQDLPEAERTVHQLVDQPNVLPGEVSVALHQLAEWHLKAGNNPAARRALAEVSTRLPGTHLAHMANLRRNQIPDPIENPGVSIATRIFELPKAEKSPNLPPPSGPSPGTAEAARQANELVRQLEQEPGNQPVREKFAQLLAESLERPETAIEQLSLLLELPDQPDQKKAHWLATMAEWHITRRFDWTAGRACLERIIHELPQTREAFSAQRRLHLRDMDVKSARRQPRAIAPRPPGAKFRPMVSAPARPETS